MRGSSPRMTTRWIKSTGIRCGAISGSKIELPKVPGQIWNMCPGGHPSFLAKCVQAGTKAERWRRQFPAFSDASSFVPTSWPPRPSHGHAAHGRISQGRLRRAGSRFAMTSLAAPLENSRHGALRWGICFAVAVATHGAAAWALLGHAPSDSGFDAGAPVVMIELPEALAAFTTPPTELAPGPTEPETEQTLSPKAETKPPEEVAEVALPEL